MVRKSLRLAVRMGLLAAVVMLLAKVVQSRRKEDDWSGPDSADWPPLHPDPVVPQPTPADVPPVGPDPDPDPAVPAPAPPPVVPDPEPAGEVPGAEWPPVQPPSPAPEPPAQLVTDRAAPVVKKARTPAPAAAKAKKPRPATAAAPAPAPALAPDGAPDRPSRTAGRRRRTRSVEVWVEAVGTACPPSHPVKAKLTSMLFHLPGMAAYNRTRPDRCYVDATAAEQDGFTRAKR